MEEGKKDGRECVDEHALHHIQIEGENRMKRKGAEKQKIRHGEHVRCRVLEEKKDEKRFMGGGGRYHIK